MDPKTQRLVWIDLEMTGLNPERDQILEIASIVTDNELRVLSEGPVLAVHQSEAVLAAMDDWNQRTHGNSGLVQRVRESRLDLGAVEAQTLDFLQAHVQPGTAPLCGNSVCQDRRFLARLMPRLERFLHYRLIDVSTIKELAYRWYPSLPRYPKTERHEALADIRESIGELQYYRERLFPERPFVARTMGGFGEADDAELP
ncbi:MULTISPECIES: oligoribonuclease [Acidithiobacillus]|jgi:oligoribonuclease|uniref:Oligoribonuclease n=3 Tax=Acidithiobacillus caldus TaxID=33059 RepID=F9ZML8_ACICS|nr:MULTISPECIES: oligoribonuclease [Acidithiobacillus]AEK57322.1 Oligoribonuclease [Acidithiobacillus caldus SM-1]AIA54583.1 3'-to-5' oligoribonuclease (orn) [Acidithiobacillus caldus ATCC 51756]AUW32073.1 oligoribonuclease [Acidithiobacillus caldus]MBU2730516.1 oligoribonuclease [Acidithiobacillus caldus]MBU2735824.1 oligoribonuclease [Acidithiobacillus caldus ATCC 51756]